MYLFTQMNRFDSIIYIQKRLVEYMSLCECESVAAAVKPITFEKLTYVI